MKKYVVDKTSFIVKSFGRMMNFLIKIIEKQITLFWHQI